MSKAAPPRKDESPLAEDEQVATYQEAIPLPYLAGKRKLSGRWMTGALNRITRKSRSEVPGKK